MVALGPSAAGDQGYFWSHFSITHLSLLPTCAGTGPYLDPTHRSAQIDYGAPNAPLGTRIGSPATQGGRRMGFGGKHERISSHAYPSEGRAAKTVTARQSPARLPQPIGPAQPRDRGS